MASCVGNKQVVLLQDKVVSGSHMRFLDSSTEEAGSAYRVASNDVLYIRMDKVNVGESVLSVSGIQQQDARIQLNHPYLLGYNVSADGTFEHPTFGRVTAAGKTLEELNAELTQLANDQFPGASVEVFLINGTVSVLGEVQRPGRYPIFKDRNSLLDVFALSGDFQTYADRKTVKIIRNEGGVNKVVHIDLTDVETLSSPYYLLQNDDIIIVSPLRRKKYTTTNIQWLVSSVTALVAVSSLIITLTSSR